MPDKREQILPVPFPFAGVDLSKGYAAQPPSTTPTALNVRGFEPGSGRMRGGSRPGLARYIPGQLGSGGLVQDLNVLVATGITPPGPPAGLVQYSTPGVAASGNATMTFSQPVTAGNDILVLAGTTTFSFATVSDSASNSYTRYTGGSFSSIAVAAYLATNVSGGTVTITAGSGPVSAVALEITGALGRDGNTQSCSTTAGGVVTLSPWTLAHSPELAFYAIYNTSSHTIKRTGGVGYSDLPTGCSNFQVAIIHLGSNGTYGGDLSWSISAADNPVAAVGGIEVSA